jgi:putative peptidoglycan lipid II flippase
MLQGRTVAHQPFGHRTPAEAIVLSDDQGAANPAAAGNGAFWSASSRATVASIAGSAPGFFIPIAIATVFGASGGTDAFLLALSVASFVANALGSTTQQAAIPFLVEARGEKRDVSRFLAEMTTVLMALAIMPLVGMNLGLPIYLGRWGHWAPADTRLLTIFLWAFVPYVVCAILAGIYSGALNALHLYVRVALSPALRSLVVLGALVLSPLIGMYALVAGYLAGEFTRMAYLITRLRRQYPVPFVARPAGHGMSEFMRSAVAQMIASGALALVPVVDRVMAAQIGAGVISILDFADRLWQVPLGFAMSGLMVTTLAHWSERLYHGGSVRDLSQSTFRLALALLAGLTPFVLVFGVWRQPLVGLAFGHTRLTPADRRLLADTLAVLVAAIPIYVAGLTYTRAFLVLKRSDLLLFIGVGQLVVKTVLNLLLIPIWGLVGIASGTAMTYCATAVLLVVVFHVRLIHTPVAPSARAGR